MPIILFGIFNYSYFVQTVIRTIVDVISCSFFANRSDVLPVDRAGSLRKGFLFSVRESIVLLYLAVCKIVLELGSYSLRLFSSSSHEYQILHEVPNNIRASTYLRSLSTYICYY